VYPPYIEGEGQGLGERQGAAQSQPGSLQSLDTPQEDQWGTFPPPVASSEIKWQPERDYANAASSHEVKGITLRDDVLHVKTGTPIRPTPKGWVVAQPTERPLAFAASHYTAGENCTAWRAITLETYKKQFRPSYRYAILEIDVYGNADTLRRCPVAAAQPGAADAAPSAGAGGSGHRESQYPPDRERDT
jgi:hypothetical protein